MRVGDLVSDGALQGIVVAHLDSGEFAPEYPRERWGYLQRGVLIKTGPAGLAHFPVVDALAVIEF